MLFVPAFCGMIYLSVSHDRKHVLRQCALREHRLRRKIIGE